MHDLRRFDPQQVGRLETWMWKAYYERRRWALFKLLLRLLRRQFHYSRLQAWRGAALLTIAAVLFQRGRHEGDHGKALPPLRQYFRLLRRSGNLIFDPDEAAILELRWWIVHRYHAKEGVLLRNALAATMGMLYRLPDERLFEHAELRARAMILRDDRGAGQMTPADWSEIKDYLRRSFTLLQDALASEQHP
jgi:hypothetical protein